MPSVVADSKDIVLGNIRFKAPREAVETTPDRKGAFDVPVVSQNSDDARGVEEERVAR